MAIIFSAVVLYICVAVFAQQEAQASRWKILGIAVVAGYAHTAVRYYTHLPLVLAVLVPLAVAAAIIAILLVTWCKVERQATIKITATYMGAMLVLSGALLAIAIYAA